MRKKFLLAGALTLLAGCSNDQAAAPRQSSALPSVPVVNASPAATATAIPTASNAAMSASATDSVTTEPRAIAPPFEIEGEYSVSWPSPYNVGVAKISATDAGFYHLQVSKVHGFSLNLGDMDSDFFYDGTRYVCTEPGYEAVTLTFDAHSLSIGYPEDVFGGYNAEPRGTYYLKNSGVQDTPFLTRLYDTLKLEEGYRGMFSDVLAYDLKDSEQILLVQSRVGFEAEDIVMENLVLFHAESQSFEPLGTVSDLNEDKLRERLKNVEPEPMPELINELLHKQQADRYTQLQIDKFYSVPDYNPLESKLTDAEAFYVFSGIKNATSVSNNRRDENNIGSIYIREVDHSDDDTVTIRVYEVVRNNEKDEHQATANWIEIDRSSGIISEMF